ncbi:MAG: NAD(P)H-dependent glycerol-3-phosphate dehydrogenase [Nitrospiraceae bacterium]|nr:NAD(P)H-dependent glycerol-3-phosphate dehydrogenase [Nitrospiraceae bacterium]
MKIQVIGAGSWGLALARLLALNGHEVHLCCRDEDGPDVLRETRKSPFYLPGVALPESIEVAHTAQSNAALAVLAVPSHAMRKVVAQHTFSVQTIRVSVAKGIENESLLRMSEVIEQAAPGGPVLTLSGPSHAEEVARDLPASVVVAGGDAEACETAQAAFVADNFRVYTSPDLVGVELGGALKNVMAIGAGVCDGFALGDNAKAALITRGLAEMSRLGVAQGADPLTFAGLSGMGDLIVTCASGHSRNRAVGERIARGDAMDQILAGPMVAEGIRTARSVHDLAARLSVEMPIAEQVYGVLYEQTDPRQAIVQLMTRDPKPERD